ncbi:MAG TPA: hypothetical protein VK640_17890 [Actinomycetes bacterium]|nr:hypothetical protein [Actinomycetes bacterium]
MTGLIGWLRRVATTTAQDCAGCGAAMAATELACPQGCGFDRRNERRLSGGAWSRLDRM